MSKHFNKGRSDARRNRHDPPNDFIRTFFFGDKKIFKENKDYSKGWRSGRKPH